MGKTTIRKIVLLCLVAAIYSTCMEDGPKNTIDLNLPDKTLLIDEEKTFQGSVTGDIETVSIYLNKSEEENVLVNEEDLSFDFTMRFSEEGVQNLNLKGLDAGGEILAEADYQLFVRTEENADPDMFNFSFPEYKGTFDRTLWSTYYYLPQVRSLSNGYPLRDLKGNRLGPVLSKRDWCNSAMEGSVRVLDNLGMGVTYNYAGTSRSYSVDCRSIFPRFPKTSQVKFRLARGSFGDGVRRYRLIPYRTIAVDRNVIPYGSLVYIPAARGNKIILPDGSETLHDGYFFAGDTGGAIKGTHIDVYIGVAKKNPFSWIKSRSSGTFKAKIVNIKSIRDKLNDLHTNF